MSQEASDDWLVPEKAQADWRSQCLAAASDEQMFSIFRRLPAVRNVAENRSAASVAPLWLAALAFAPSLPSLLPVILENDVFGDAPAKFCAFPPMSPTTAFYATELACLVGLFGPLDGMRVAEIGGGYGGMATIVTGCFPRIDYTIYDIPEAIALQKRYCGSFNRCPIHFRDEVVGDGEFDLCIASASLCELGGAIKERYGDAVIARSARGLMLWNAGSDHGSPEWFHGADNVVPWLRKFTAPRKVFCFTDSPLLAHLWGEDAANHYAWGCLVPGVPEG